MTLPRLLRRRLFRFVEIDQSRLRTGIEFHLQRIVILPGDMQPARLPHDAAYAEGFALQSGLIILRQIPCIGDTNTLRSEWQTFKISSARCRHAMSPVFTYNRNPIAREIDRSDGLGWLRAALSATLSIRGNNKTQTHQAIKKDSHDAYYLF